MKNTKAVNPTPATAIPLNYYRAVHVGAHLERMRQAAEAGHPTYGPVYFALVGVTQNAKAKIRHIGGKPREIKPGQAWVTCQQVADLLGLCESTVRRALQWWEKQGIIRREILKSRARTTIGQLITLLYWEQDVVKTGPQNSARAPTGATGQEVREKAIGVGDRVDRMPPEGGQNTEHYNRSPTIGNYSLLEEGVREDVEIHPGVLGLLQEVILARNDVSQDAVSVRSWFRTVVETYAEVTASTPSEAAQRGLADLAAEYGADATTKALIEGMACRKEWLAAPKASSRT